MMDRIMNNENGQLKWGRISKRFFRSKSVSYAAPDTPTMPTCVPVSNNVGDVNAVAPPRNPQQDSKLQKIMACLFWKKKTDVVDMKKDQKMAEKKKMAVDRSERSRRVLKMESMKEAPKHRDPGDEPPPSPGANQMFLPSENPTASFLSYLNPTVRRACSDVIRTNNNSSNSSRSTTREAFVENSKPPVTRNTNYRGQRATDREPPSRNSNTKPWELDRPPRPPERSQSQRPSAIKPIVVPGIMSCSDDDVGYNSDNDICDLHEELSRMNMSQPELRHVGTNRRKGRKREGAKSSSECSGSLFREGSISLSEGSGTESEEEERPVISRPQNPSPGQQKRKVFHTVPTEKTRGDDDDDEDENILVPVKSRKGAAKPKVLENAIDDLFLQTQNNIENIYRNGLDNMDLETFRSGTATPETCMRRIEADLFTPTVSDKELTAKKTRGTKDKASVRENNRNVVTHNMNKLSVTDVESEHMNKNDNQEMDSLLAEVSIWAKDRQNWLLEDGKLKPDATKEHTQSSMAVDDKAIASVSRSNTDRCSEWVDSLDKTGYETKEPIAGILTCPKLFRSSNKSSGRNVSFSDTDSGKANSMVKSNNDFLENRENKTGGVQIVTLANLDDRTRDEHERVPSDMYNHGRSRSGDDDRSTINDNLSELDHKERFRARSPDSWLSSNGSCSNMMLKPDTARDDRDSFGTASPFQNTPDLSVKRTASEPAKSHQIIRKKPVIHTPFATFGRQRAPRQAEGGFIGDSVVKNTQLKPLSMQMNGNFQDSQFPGYKSNNLLAGSRNINDFESNLTSNVQSTRPYSEIPVRDSFGTNDRLMFANANNAVPNYNNNVSMSLGRPVSETVAPTKRSDKIGMGNIMATNSLKERNKYARDIVNSFNKPKPVTHTDAFQSHSVNGVYDDETSEPQKQKRHTVFNQKLINGGYSYEKHSRKHKESDEDGFMDISVSRDGTNESQFPDIRKNCGNVSSREQNKNTASVSELSLQLQGSQEYKNGMKTAVLTREAMNQIFSSNKHTLDVKIGTGSSQKNSGVPTSSEKHTASKFKKIRSRRDQEMEWLMKDAAETEV